MNDNNFINLNHPEKENDAEYSAQADMQPAAATAVMDISPKPKKSGIGKKTITAILACAVVAGGLFAANKFLKPDPEVIVKAAFAETVSGQQAAAENMYNTIPAARQMFEPVEVVSQKQDFDFTVKSVEDVPYAQLISAFAANCGIRGSVSTSIEQKISNADFTVYTQDKDLIDGEMYLSPELITVSVPEISSKTLSVNPSTLKEDYKNSIFYSLMPMTDEDLELFQQSILTSFENQSLSAADIEKMSDDLEAIAANSLTNAEYSYDEATKRYIVTIPGADAKATILEIYRYIYLDAPIAPMMEKALSPVITSEELSYGEFINRLLENLEATLPELPTNISLEIENKVIKTANISIIPAAAPAEGSELSISSITAELALSDTKNDIVMNFGLASGEEATDMTVTLSDLFENDTYTMDMIISATSNDAAFTIPFNIKIAANGDFTCGATADIQSEEGDNSFAFSAKGTVTYDNSVLSYNLSDCVISAVMPENSAKIGFALSGTNSPLTELPAAPDNHVEVLKFDYQDIENLQNEITQNSQSFVAKLYKIFLGI